MNNYATRRESFLTRLIVFISLAVPVLVTALVYIKPPQAAANLDLRMLPLFHAILNGSVAVLLSLSYWFIKQKNVNAHKTCNIIALILSALFLVSYITYHSLTEPTRYGGTGTLKYIYYFILLTHIVLAALILPLILFTFLRAFAGKFDQHRRLARWTMPLWLYVSITGVLVYLLISPYY